MDVPPSKRRKKSGGLNSERKGKNAILPVSAPKKVYHFRATVKSKGVFLLKETVHL